VRSTSAAVRRQGIHFGGSLPSSAGIVGTDDARKAGPAGRHRRARRRLGATGERTSSACRLRRSGRPGWAHRLAPVGWQPEGQGSSPPGSTSRGNAAQGTCTASARSARSRAARHPASLACSVRDPVDIAPPFSEPYNCRGSGRQPGSMGLQSRVLRDSLAVYRSLLELLA
jgi:hypothetical protein